MQNGLEGKIAIITGSAQGIGKAIAQQLVDNGSTVVVSDIQIEKGKATAAELGNQAIFVPCDVSDAAQVHQLFDTVLERFGRLDVMINNAAYTGGDFKAGKVPIDRYPEDLWRKTMDVVLTGTFNCSKAAAVQMIKQKSGTIINIASVAGVVALRLQIGYVAAKAGVIRMTQAMACELGPHGIRVNSVSPGSTLTEPVRRQFYDDDAVFKDAGNRILSFIPLGRPGEVHDIASVVAFLASDDSAYISGHNIVVDGGWTAGFNRDF